MSWWTRRSSRATTRPYISVEATSIEGYPEAEVLERSRGSRWWRRAECQGDTENYYEVQRSSAVDPHPAEHLSRRRRGPVPGARRGRRSTRAFSTTTVDLLAQENGGRLLDTSDAFYSTPANLILSNRARIMGEGWENARRRGRRQRLGAVQARRPGRADHGRGRHLLLHRQRPGQVRISVADETKGSLEDDSNWWDIVPKTRSLVDTRHRFLVDRAARGDAPAPGRLPRWRPGPTALLRRDRRRGPQGSLRPLLRGTPGRTPALHRSPADPETAAPAARVS